MGQRTISKGTIRKIARWCGWLALALLLVTMLSGYGISQFRVVDRVTFGLLSKAISHRLHLNIEIPLLVLTLLHVGLVLWGRRSVSKRR